MQPKHIFVIYVSLAVVSGLAAVWSPWLVVASCAALIASVSVTFRHFQAENVVEVRVSALEAEFKTQQIQTKKIEGDLQTATNKLNMAFGVRK